MDRVSEYLIHPFTTFLKRPLFCSDDSHKVGIEDHPIPKKFIAREDWLSIEEKISNSLLSGRIAFNNYFYS